MADVLALQDLELEGPDSGTPRTGTCCFSNWASLSNLTVEIN